MPLPPMQWSAAQQLQQLSDEQIGHRAPASDHHALLRQPMQLQPGGVAAVHEFDHDFDHEFDHGDAVAAIDDQLEQLLQVGWCYAVFREKLLGC